jgi:DNA-3-methyladenine glycosylase II
MREGDATLNKPTYWARAKKHLSATDPVMATLVAEYKGESLMSRGSAFFSLARAIVGQQISVKAAESVWRKFEAGLGGDVLPATVLAGNDAALRSFGLSGQKVLYLRELSQFFIARENPSWHRAKDEAVIADLISIKGIGRWSAEMFLIFHLLRPDVFPIADLGLRRAMEKQYFNGRKTGPSLLIAQSEIWKPYRTVATWYLWRSLDPVAVEY